MVELKSIYAKPMGVVTLKMYYQRIFASCAYKDYNPKSGAPKMAKPIKAYPDPGDIDNETRSQSIEEAEQANETYYDQAVELAPRTYSIGYLASSPQPLTESGLGASPSGGSDPYFVNAYPDTSFGDVYYRLTAYNKTNLFGVPNTNDDNYVSYLYPLCVTVPAKISIDRTKGTYTFVPRMRNIEFGLFIQGKSGTFKISLGSWESPYFDIEKYKPLTNLNPAYTDFQSTLGEPNEHDSAITLYPNLRMRSSVTHITTSSALTDEHCGGIRDLFHIDASGVDLYHGHQFLPTFRWDGPGIPEVIIGFEYTCGVEFIGHNVDLGSSPWHGRYTTSQKITGPGYMELVLGQWRVISLTIPDNLSPISGMGGVGGEY